MNVSGTILFVENRWEPKGYLWLLYCRGIPGYCPVTAEAMDEGPLGMINIWCYLVADVIWNPARRVL